MVDQAPIQFHLDDDPLWYKDAIIYETHVRTFYDSDGDGIGDFWGLTQKLDYLQDLGVTAIWLLPFYVSPLKDDGYDIADYSQVHPSYGTLRHFRNFVREAQQRGLRVITELVINHTSDQHPWFQRARHAPPGSQWRNFYVWSDTPDKYRDARIIFKDFETSNWDWDPVAKSYYWHRFYKHQPDLNFDSALVRRAVIRTMDFYFNLGVSGLRLDAIPYLYERDGTTCENLADTHRLLKELRGHIDERFKNRILLAEANQWPEDAVAYFGEGDECHMAFHFPLMPRMFMAIRMEDRFPIVDILQQTPAILNTCQWALFLRNHDELTLEMVTDEERDYMYRLYAHDRHARINLGIRRRLAPLLNNDRNKIELMNSLLFSLPGTPVIYYGDEIGMGDNFYLGDRNGVRTPMQWSPDRNAGFSYANPQKLYLPVITDPEYHYEAVNVETQQNNSDSLLWWMKRLISLRKRYKAFARGSLEFLNPENSKVLAFIRRYEDETILVVANLSRLAQHAYLDLHQFSGKSPVELFGQSAFPPASEEPYPITLGPYGFYWFSLEPQHPHRVTHYSQPSESLLPVLTVRGDWRDLLARETRAALSGVLIGYIKGRRWFGGKARTIRALEILDVIQLNANHGHHWASVILAQIEYADGEPETYLLPLTFASGEEAEQVIASSPHALVARVETGNGSESGGIIYDAMVDHRFNHFLLEAIGHHRHFRGERGEVIASPTRAFRQARGAEWSKLEPIPLRVEQSNTSIAYGDRLILKLFRRLGEGQNPDLEIGRFLTERAAFPHIPPVAGALEYRRSRTEEQTTVGILQGYVPNQGDAWRYTLDSLGYYFEQVLAYVGTPPIPDKSLLELSQEETPHFARDTVGPYLSSARLLGQRTAELHVALASSPGDPAFAPEPFSDHYRRSLYQSMRSATGHNFTLLRKRLHSLAEDVQKDAQEVLNREGNVLACFRQVLNRKVQALRLRCHGDYHLGQVLYTGNNFVIIDFEGEPARPLTERRIKRCPLRDVAGMVRSFHYAAYAALLGQAPTVLRTEDRPTLEQWARLWYLWVSSAFLKSYLETASQAAFLPQNRDDLALLLDTYLLSKAVYEIGYELNNRPDWLRVPLQGILQLLEGYA